MGFSLRIGELEITDEGKDARSERRDDAPAFGEPTDYTNNRWPSYTSWNNAMRFVGLEDLMRNKKTGLLRNHPGCVELTQEHKKIIDQAYADFYKKYPNCKPGYSKRQLDDDQDDDANFPEENNWAVRLEWLKYWVDWALENCKQPVFYNS